MKQATEARRLLRAHRYGALSTLSVKLAGYPFGSITPYMVDHDGSLIIQISALAEHTRNIAHDNRVSLITHNQDDPAIQMQGRVTVTGNAERLDQAHPRYIRHFPDAAFLATLDFFFYRITPVAIRYIGGPGRVHWIDTDSYPAPQAADFIRHEERLLGDINTRQAGIVHRLLLQHDCDADDAVVFSLDCDGLDIRCRQRIHRLNLSATLEDPLQFEQLSTLDCRPAA